MKRCNNKNLFFGFFLLFNLILFSVFVNAGLINWTGQNNVQGIMNMPDTITAYYSAGTSSGVQMNGNACSYISPFFMCSESVSVVYDDYYNIEFNTLDNDGNIYSGPVEYLIVDTQSPIFNSFNVETSALGVKFYYNIQDEYIYSSQSAGLDKLEFYADSTLLGTIELNGEHSTSSPTAGVDFEYGSTANFYMKAYDRVDNVNESEQIELEIVKATVSNFGIQDSSTGIPITKISLSNPIVATIVFDVTAQSVQDIVANISEIVKTQAIQNQYENLTIPETTCIHINNNTFRCGMGGIYIDPINSTITLGFNIVANGGVQSSSTLTHTFQIDNDAPNIESIETDYCYDDTCYIPNGRASKITLRFDDTSEQFARRQVFYTLSGSTYPVSGCANGVCYHYLTKECSSGNSYLLKLKIGSAGAVTQDDAGNKVTNNVETQIFCDNLKPYDNTLGNDVTYQRELDEFSGGSSIQVIPNSDYGLNLGGQPLSINAYVFEDGPVVNAVANFSRLGDDVQEVSCVASTEVDNLFICSFGISNLINEFVSENIEFTFYDLVNNSKTVVEEDITVLKNDARSETPDCLTFTSKDVNPSSINRIALGLANSGDLTYPIYGEYDVQRKSGTVCADIHINEQIIGDCYLEFSNGTTMGSLNMFNDLVIANPYSDVGTNYVDFIFSTLDPNLAENIDLVCNVSFIVSDDEYLYVEPLTYQAEWPISFFNSALGRPGERYTEKIKEFEEGGLAKLQKVISIANQFAATMSEVCAMSGHLDTIGLAGDTLVTVEKALEKANLNLNFGPVSIGNIGATMGSLPAKIKGPGDQARDGVSRKDAVGLIGNIFDFACTWSTCSLGNYLSMEAADTDGLFNSFITSGGDGLSTGIQGDDHWSGDPLLGGNGGYQSQGGILTFNESGDELADQLFGDIGRPDLYNSIIMSIATQCWPAIIYHANQWMESECNRIYCYKRNAQYGLGISSCDASQGVFVCKKVIGEVVELVPALREAKNLANNANDLVKNLLPNLLVNTLSAVACGDHYKKVVREGPEYIEKLSLLKIITCEIPLSVGRMIRGQRASSGLGGFNYPVTQDVCALALCNKEDESECEVSSGWLSRLAGTNEFGGVQLFNNNEQGAVDQMHQLQAKHRQSGGYSVDFGKYVDGLASGESESVNSYGRTLRFDYGFGVDYDLSDVDNLNNMVRGSDDSRIEALNGYIGPIYDSAVGLSGPGGETIPTGSNYWNYGIKFANIPYESDMQYQSDANWLAFTSDLSAGVPSPSIGYIGGFGSNTINYLATEKEDSDSINLNNQIGSFEERIAAYNKNKNELYNSLQTNPPSALIPIFDTDDNGELSDDESRKWAAYLSEVQRHEGNLDLARQELIEKMKNNCNEGDATCINAANEYGKRLENGVKKSHNEIKDNQNKVKKEVAKMEKRTDALARIQETRKYVDFAMRFLWDNWLKDYASSLDISELFSDTIGFDINSINSEAWKNDICNPKNDIWNGGVDDSTAMDCTGSTCIPVLSMAIEKTIYNYTDENRSQVDKYLYTYVFYVGPVKEEFNFNAYLHKQNGAKSCIYRDGDECKSILLNVDGNQSFFDNSDAFISSNDYNKLCIEFDKPYPGTLQSGGFGSGSKDEYCRYIVDSPDSDFETGEPDLSYGEELTGNENDKLDVVYE